MQGHELHRARGRLLLTHSQTRRSPLSLNLALHSSHFVSVFAAHVAHFSAAWMFLEVSQEINAELHSITIFVCGVRCLDGTAAHLV
eukprot:2512948-Amphidinium_carterae.1